jgi:hypothetical protein
MVACGVSPNHRCCWQPHNPVGGSPTHPLTAATTARLTHRLAWPRCSRVASSWT